MLRGRFESAGESTPDELRAAYDDVLVETVEQVGREIVADQTGIEPERLDALVDGESPDLELTEAAAILATDSDMPDAEAIEAEARDILMMGMSIAVLDIEAIASGLNDELEPKEIQQKIEGRHPINLDDYALLHSYIEGEKQ